jgi:hypothetical protein
VFDDPLEEQFQDFKSVGLFALIRLPKKFSLSKIAVIWVHSLRARAFHNGEVLEQTEKQRGAVQRQAVEADLRIQVTNTAINVLSSRLNPVAWLRLLKSPSITMSLVAPLALFALPMATRSNVVIVALAIVALYIILAYFGLLRMIARLGSEISLAAQAVIERAEMLLPNAIWQDEQSRPL